jgi:hypothetical protein
LRDSPKLRVGLIFKGNKWRFLRSNSGVSNFQYTEEINAQPNEAFPHPHRLKSIIIRSLPAALPLTTASFIGLEEHHLIRLTFVAHRTMKGMRVDSFTAHWTIQLFVACRSITPCTLNWRHNHCVSLDEGTSPDKP